MNRRTTTGAVAAVDLGATSGRVVVGVVGPDALKATQVERFANEPVRTIDGLHWDLLGLYASALDGLRSAVRSQPELASIGIDSWAVDYGLLRGTRLLGDPFHYRDERTSAGVAAVHQRFPLRQLYARNGLQFLPFNTLYQLASEPEAMLETADALLLIPDLLAYWMTGERFAELTNASTTGLLAPALADGSRPPEWDVELTEGLGIRPELLQPLIAPATRIGRLSGNAAAAVGTSRVSVTAVASHDTASAVVAVPMIPERSAYISCGTWGLVGVELSAPNTGEDAFAAGFTNELGADDRIRFLHNVMGLWILSEATRTWEQREGRRIPLKNLLSAAEHVPAESVPVFDVNDPSFLAPGDMESRIRVWCESRHRRPPAGRAEYVRSILESLAVAFADAAVRAAQIAKVDLHSIHIVGGGSLNTILCQRIADRAGLPVVAGPSEATSLGNILIQARAAGLVTGSLEALRDLVERTQNVRRYLPSTP